MSRVTRRKHIMKEMMDDDFELPKGDQQIVRVVSSRGNNLHEVEYAECQKENFLVTMPTKFRKNVWIKRGDYLLVEPIDEGDKVKAEIIRILTAEHIKEYTKHNVWPKQFTKKRPYDDYAIEGDELDRNLNRQTNVDVHESDDSSSEEEK